MKATSFPVTEPRRIEVNLAADLQRLTGETYSYVRNLFVWARDAYVDDFRIGAGYTVERNSLLPGAVAHIASTRTFTATAAANGSPRYSDSYLHYDHIGNVLCLSNSSGALSTSFSQDAWGNVLSSASTGGWSASFSGRHLTTKEYDAYSDLYYFWLRDYDPEFGLFLSSNAVAPYIEHRYNYAKQSPIMHSDPNGMRLERYGNWCGPGWSGGNVAPPKGPADGMDSCCMTHDMCYLAAGVVWWNPATWKAKRACDLALCACLSTLVLNDLSLPGGLEYFQAMQCVFDCPGGKTLPPDS